TFEVTSTYYDWSMESTTTTAVEGAQIDIENGTLVLTTDAEGQALVTPGALSAGTYNYQVTKEEEGSAPQLVRTDGLSFEVNEKDTNSGGSSEPTSYRVYLAVIDEDGELIYSPRRVSISENDTYGLTALGALDASGLDYSFSDDNPGMVVNIEGLENFGLNGWMYSVDGSVPKVLPGDKTINSGDKVLFWYSTSAMEGSPDWPNNSSGTSSPGSSEEESETE
ncbi:MAG TPA: hypothetical protein DHM42_00530, partial [Clostridiales bacterium]|nr:hypothetical protein [Clostridiales bacterium]